MAKGLQPGPCGGELQPIWVTEPNCSKITMSLEGSTRDPFPKEEQGQQGGQAGTQIFGGWKGGEGTVKRKNGL